MKRMRLPALAAALTILTAGCAQANGECTIDLGNGPISVALLVTESRCQSLCDSQYGRDDCVWTEQGTIDSRISGPGI